MKNNILHRFLSALAALLCMCSCVLNETYIPENNGTVDVVFRPTSYYNQTVGTKADGETSVFDVEDVIYSAFLVVFDNQGRCILRDPLTITENKTISARTLKTDKSLSQATLCVIVNVPQAFVNEWTSDNDDNHASDLDKFMHAEIDYSSDNSPFSFAAQSTTTPCVGIPQVVLNDETKQCFPMFGYTNRPCDLSRSGSIQIEIKRLFARIDVTLSLNINEDDNPLTSKPQFTLSDCEIFNIPQKVSLITSDRTSCAVVTDDDGTLLGSEVMGSFNLSNVNSTNAVDNIVSNKTTGKSIYFYVPEHKLGITDLTNTDQKNKPLIVEGTSYKALYATINGILVDGNGVSHDAQYNLYFGLNATNDFDISRNTKYNNSLIINGTSDKDTDHRVQLEQLDGFVESLVTKGKTANCYVIGQTGTYLLPAYKGAFNSMEEAEICAEGTNEILVCDNPNIIIEIDNERSKQSTIVIKISHNASLENVVMTGNAVIARKNSSGNVEWSWHLWFVPGVSYNTDDSGIINVGELTFGGVGSNSMQNDKMMDRNLGVYTKSSDISNWIPGTDNGVYYKYGRKEPYFTGIDTNGQTVTSYHGNEVDAYAAWSGDKKSKTDPCPIGYRVPTKSVWDNKSGVLKINNTATNSFGYTATIAYPYSGYIDAVPKLNAGDTSNGKDQTPLSNVKVPNNQDGPSITDWSGIKNKPNYDPIICSKIQYKSVDLDKSGYLLTSSNGEKDLLKYYYEADGFELIECTYIKGTWERKGTISKYWAATYSNEQKKNPYTKTADEIATENKDLYNAIIDGIKTETSGFWGGILNGIAGALNIRAEIEWVSVDNSYGYQVRCVQEKE